MRSRRRDALLANSCLTVRRTEIALAEMIRDLVKRTLFPFLGLGQPEDATFGIQRRTLTAHRLLTAYLHEFDHDHHSMMV